MIVNDETCAPLIERLLQALIDDKRSLFLEANCLPGRINWSFRVDVNDTGKVIGSKGTHLRALQLLIELMGKRADEQWCGLSIDPTGVERPSHPATDASKAHSTEEDWKLLCELLVALGINATVTPAGSVESGYTFRVEGSRVQDHEALLEPHEAIYKRNQMSRDPLNVVGALGTLFRSIGRRQGVRYRIDSGA